MSAASSNVRVTAAPELLAPAGNWACARAAVENGADAIYFGLERFNARMRADNFTEADLPDLMAYLHRRGVKGYLTFNTLVFADELSDAETHLRTVIAARVDAAIVQDVGVCRLIRRLSPDFPIHASTQMTITSAAGVAFARDLGCELVVLARECSLKEVGRIQSELSPGGSAAGAGSAQFPLEVFVHGALCVAYSGQCLTSEALGGRSANRGECAQACRMPYDLISDGQVVPLGDRRYLLSPQDLAGVELLPELIEAGVVSLKIEGRLKTAEYVASITGVYRRALDRVWAAISEGADAKAVATAARDSFARERYPLEMAFSRGLHTGWFRGVNNQSLVHGRFGKKRGVYLGRVRRIGRERVFLELEGPLKPGDGVVFDAGNPEEPEEGGRVYGVSRHGTEAAVSFGKGDLDWRRIGLGDRVWKTSDPELDRGLRQSFSGAVPRFRRPVSLRAEGAPGVRLAITAWDECGNVVQAVSNLDLVPAENQPLTSERLREQLGRLGGTGFRLDSLDNRLNGAVMLPLSELNRLRRELVRELEDCRAQAPRWVLRPPEDYRVGDELDSFVPPPIDPVGGQQDSEWDLAVLVRDTQQLEAALQSGGKTFYCEFEDPRKYRAAVEQFRAWQRTGSGAGRSALLVAPPRVTKTGEEWILKQVGSCGADGYLIRNYDHLKFFDGERRIGDFSLNVANPLTAKYFMTHFDLERVTASYDLNAEQLEALVRTAPPEWFEVTIHQHMPMFHMEHCVFCAFLTQGTDYTNCGRPCERHRVELRDRVGVTHPLKADAGCRNTVFNGRAQTGADYVGRLLRLGVRRFRLEFLNETAAQVTRTIGRYRALFRGEITGAQLWRELKLVHQLGVTRGAMERREGG